MKRNNPIGHVRPAVFLVIAFAALTTVGCSAGVKYGAANIASNPAGANIINLRDDTNLGKTPSKVVWKGPADSSEKVTIRLQKNGYRSSITSFWINKRFTTEEAARDNAIDVHSELVKK
jgi:hypothetical protein